MNLQEKIALVYFIIGFFVMALPVFDPKTAKSYDKMDTGAFIIGCMIIWFAWPLVFWYVLSTFQKDKK